MAVTHQHETMHGVDVLVGRLDESREGGGRDTLGLGTAARQRRRGSFGRVAEGSGEGAERDESDGFHDADPGMTDECFGENGSRSYRMILDPARRCNPAVPRF